MQASWTKGISGLFLIRLLVVSYFAALAIGLLPGADLAPVFGSLIPPEVTHYVVRFALLTLSGLILFNIRRRAATTVLGALVFYCAYVALYTGGPLDAFWRDLALIGALLLIGRMPERPSEVPVVEPEIEDPSPTPPRRRTVSRPYRADLEAVRGS